MCIAISFGFLKGGFHVKYDPREPVEFSRAVAQKLKQLRPELSVSIHPPLTLGIDKGRVDLSLLAKQVQAQPEEASALVDAFLRSFLDFSESDVSHRPLSELLAHVMPRIRSDTALADMDSIPHLHFGNNTVVSYVIDQPGWTVSITNSQLQECAMKVEDLHELAIRNLENKSEETEIRIVETKESSKVVFLESSDGYDSSRILLSNLWGRLSPLLGKEFYVAVPNRDILLAFECSSAVTQRLREKTRQIFHESA
ncbi:MAG: DUF1444 family protein, partial [Proteobacteria bacterium]|nr:DUF1444 family protein [Pseudomonadota bacterium]